MNGVTFDQPSATRIARTVKRVEGTPVDRTNDTRERRDQPAIAQVFRITSATRDGSNFRWTYTGYRQIWIGGFGWSDTGSLVTLLNLVEADNGASGTVSGIAIAGFITGINPIPNVRTLAAITYAADGEAVYVFTLPNAPVIDCEAV